jgi:hypothetical protein
MKKQFRDFESAREFVRALNLKGQKEWLDYCKSGNKPHNIPANPHRSYKKDFKGLGDYLGTGTVATNDRAYRPFTETREFVRSLGLKNRKEWEQYCKSGNKPDYIPSSPTNHYKKDFKGMGDYLGTGTVAPQDKQFLPFKEAREFVRSLVLKNQKEWQEYSKSGNKPDYIPSNPWNVYEKEWTEWGDYLGTGNVASQNRTYRPYKEAREFVRSLGLKDQKEWREYCASGNKPDDIPANPWKVYKEWKKK